MELTAASTQRAPLLRYSRGWLTLKYLNREPRLAGGLILLCFGTVFIGLMSGAIARDVRFALRGRTATAVIENKFLAQAEGTQAPAAAGLLAHGGGRNRTRYVVRFNFTVDGKKMSGEKSLGRREWNRSKPGDQLELVYLPEHPQTYRVGPPLWLRSEAILPAIGGWFVFLSFSTLRAAVRDAWATANLLATGVAAVALVSKVEAYVSQKKGESLRRVAFDYLVTSPSGKQLFSGELPWFMICGRQKYAPGDDLVAVYDPAEPTRHVIDAFGARGDSPSL